GGEATGRIVELQSVQPGRGRTDRRQLGVVLQIQLIALGLGIADIGGDLHIAKAELVVPASGVDLVLALVVHATHQREQIGRRATDEGAVAVDLCVADVDA
ncbi:Uncharacterized protein APZ42_002914, partial [Daphnia magna]